MTSVIAYKKGSNEISYLIKNCVRKGNDLCGSNMNISGIKPDLFDFVWTNDEVNEVLDKDGKQIGFDKTIDQITPSPTSENIEIKKPTMNEYGEAIKERKGITEFNTYLELEQYIDANVVDIDSVKVVLKRFGKVLLSLSRQIDYEIK